MNTNLPGVLLLSVFLLAGCDANEPDNPRASSDALLNVALSLVDEAGHPLDPATAAPDTPLYEFREHNPIMTPDGHHVTLAEFNAVRGRVEAECVRGGTEVTLELSGLIPNGLYTLWNLTFEAPGFEPTFAHMIGIGAMGLADGSQNTFRASAAGAGRLTATTPPGALSMLGTLAPCALTGEFEWHVVGAYHLDDRSHGVHPGPDGTAVEQFGFIFIRE